MPPLMSPSVRYHLGCVSRLLVVAATLVMAIAPTGAALAEDDQSSAAGYLQLYPTGDVYQIQMIGDGLAEGLKSGLIETFRGDARVQVKPKVNELPSLMKPDFADQLRGLDDMLGREQPQIAVVMVGGQERTSLRVGAKKFWLDSDEWREEFARQVDAIMKTLKRRRIAVYWVSLPNVRRSEPNEDAQMLNEIIREKAVLNGLKYIDAYAGFTDEGGGYSAMGPDLAGKIHLLREQNGVNFTEAGNRKLAHFVERELKRDLSQAKRDRAIPLAGGEAEQAAIAAARQAQLKQNRVVTGPSVSGLPASAPQPAPGAGDQKADSGRISLAITSPGGREEVISVDLLRPSIPASVIELVNKKDVADKPTSLGDLLIDKIPGGLIVMSSISAADGGAGSRSRLPPTQTAYFRVMVKGERMPVRAERADDVTWPRPEPPPLEREPAAVPAAAPATPPAAAPAAKPTKPKRAETDQGVRVR